MPPQITCPHCGSTINLENRKGVDFEKIMYALDKSPKTFTELLTITNLPRKTLSIRLKELCTSGSIIKDGGYHLNSSIKPTDKILRKRNGNGKMNGTMLHLGKNVQWIPAALIVCLVLIAFGSAVMLSPLPPGPKAPNAGFSINPLSSITVGRTVGFDASISIDSDGYITSYSWEFGDGATASGKTVSHAYLAEGSYSVILLVKDDRGLADSKQETLYVYSVPQPMMVKFTVLPDPTRGWENKWIINKPLTFDASEFNEQNGYASYYAWDYGDGAIGSGATVSHSYQQAGTYSVALTVTDLKGTDHTLVEEVTILDMPTTTVYVKQLPPIGDTVTLEIWVSGVTNLFGWQMGMTFNPAMLQCVTVPAPSNAPPDAAVTAFAEGYFLQSLGGSTLWMPGTVGNGVIVPHGSTLTDPAKAVSGDGVLATVMFKVIGAGEFDIHLTSVTLIGPDASTEIPVYVAT